MAQNITIAKLNTLVTANAAQFNKELDSAANHASHAGEAIKKVLESVGIGLSLAGVVELGKTVIEFGSHITDLAIEAGMSNQAFQTLAAGAADAGLDMDQVAKASSNLRTKLQEAADGSQTIRDELAKLHLTFAGLQSLAPEKQWEAIGRAVEESTDKQQAFNIVSDIFGAKIGPKLHEVLAKLAGPDGFQGLSDEMAKLRLTDEQLASLDKASDGLKRLWTQVKVMTAQGVLKWGDWIGQLVHAGPQGHSLADSWGRISNAAFGPDEADVLAKFRSFDNKEIRGPDGSVTHFGGEGASNLAEKLGEQMAKGAKDFAAAHPFDSITAENAQTAKVKGLLDAFFGPLDAASKLNRSQQPNINFPGAPTDRLTRIGLLNDGSKTIADENKKQTDLLKGVIEELKSINMKTGAGSAAVFA